MGHYIQWNKASVLIKIHWTWMLQPRSVRQKKDGTLHSIKQGKCFNQDTLDFECYNQGV